MGESAVSVVSYGSDILGYVRVVMRGFCMGESAVSVVSYGSDILGYVRVVMIAVNCTPHLMYNFLILHT
jgi:hypothetical protein